MRNTRTKGHQNQMTNAQANTAPAVGEQGAQDAPAKTPAKRRTTHKKDAKPKKEPKAGSAKDAVTPRVGSKGAKVLEMIARANGASLDDLMKATGWQAHSIRGFLSTASKKLAAKIESSKNDKGERIYRIAK